jgi:hypothetical protein
LKLFSVENIEILDEVNNSQFCTVELSAFASGDNLHDLPTSDESLRETAYTIYDKPLVWIYDRRTQDIGGHHKDEQPCGFVHREDNPIVFERLPDNRLMLKVKAKIWKKYSLNILELFQKSDGVKPVSVEIEVLDSKKREDGKIQILSWVYQAITILGSMLTPAIPSAQAEIIAFEAAKEEYLSQHFVEKKSIKIDNSKESAADGKWTNPNRKLYKPILEASNAKALLNEAYLIVDEDYDTNPSGALHYPHHIVRDGKLLVHISGVQSAFARAKQQGLTGDPISHLKRHYKELGLDMENFEAKEDDDVPKVKEEFGLTINQTRDIISSAISEFKYGEHEWRKYWVTDFDEEFVYLYDNEDDKIYRCTYSIAENVATVDMESKAEVIRGGYELVGEQPAEGFEEEGEEKEEPETDEEDYAAKCAEMESKMQEMEAKMSALEAENTRLQAFESSVKDEQKTMEIETILSKFSKKIPKDKLDELREKGMAAENIDAFKNEVKAVAFDYIEKNDDKSEINRMGAHVNDAPAVKKFW